MQMWTEIRRRVLVEGASKRSIRRDYGVGAETIEKILANSAPPGNRKSAPRPKTKLEPFLPVIEEILARDRDAPPKQHHTAKRIFERLRDEYGYSGGITQVKEAVARHKRHAQEVFVPLSHPPGEAQFDFGQATVEIAGVRRKAAFAVMSLPYSDGFHVSAYPRGTETFQAAHVAAFSFFGAVPTRTAYDNTTIAVRKVIGRERELTREFLRLESHFLFTHRFCRVGRGNEKGHVESLVGYGRRNFMVPVPSCCSFAELNARLEVSCRADLHRRVRGKPMTKAELLEVDRAAMLPIPPPPSRPAGWFRQGRTRCPWCASTATTTRSRRPSPITSSPSWAGSRRSASWKAPGWWRPTPAVGRRSRPPSIPATTWHFSRESPVPSMSPDRSKTGSCRGASPCSAGGWRPIFPTSAPGSSSRCSAFSSTPRWASSPGPCGRPLRSGPRARMPSPSSFTTARSVPSRCSAWTVTRTCAPTGSTRPTSPPTPD